MTRLAIVGVGTGVALSGGLWLLFHHFVVEQGEFGPRPNALEPWWLTIHGAFAFASVWLFGLLWNAHLGAAWPLSRRRRSGGALAGTAMWLILSGYLLYYVGDDQVRSILSFLHWGSGFACLILYAIHRRFP